MLLALLIAVALIGGFFWSEAIRKTADDQRVFESHLAAIHEAERGLFIFDAPDLRTALGWGGAA